ncbi:MAG: hypothetical protein H0W00_02935, partial [Chloroflexi bacterium]|nr:hypothetical protein [Chloroflexota bacterium]
MGRSISGGIIARGSAGAGQQRSTSYREPAIDAGRLSAMGVPYALLALAFTITACSSSTTPGASISPTATGSPATSPPAPSTAPAPSISTGSGGPGGTPVPDASTSPGPADPDSDGASRDLILRVDVGGGVAGPDQNALSIPQVSIYADGRVISQGVQIMIYPGPALPPLMLSRLSP